MCVCGQKLKRTAQNPARASEDWLQLQILDAESDDLCKRQPALSFSLSQTSDPVMWGLERCVALVILCICQPVVIFPMASILEYGILWE